MVFRAGLLPDLSGPGLSFPGNAQGEAGSDPGPFGEGGRMRRSATFLALLLAAAPALAQQAPFDMSPERGGDRPPAAQPAPPPVPQTHPPSPPPTAKDDAKGAEAPGGKAGVSPPPAAVPTQV